MEEEEEQVEWGKEDEPVDDQRGSDVAAENDRLRGIIRSLTVKISELEKELSKKDALLAEYARKEQKIQMVASADRWKRAPVAIGTTESVSSPVLDISESNNDDGDLKSNGVVPPIESPEHAIAPSDSRVESLEVGGVEGDEEVMSGRVVGEGEPPAVTDVHSAMKMLDEEAEEEEDDGWS